MRLDLGTEAWLALRDPGHAREVWTVIDKNRNSLSQWFPWVDACQSETDTCTSILSSIEQAREGRSLNLGIWINASFAGMVSFTNIDQLRHKASLGYWLDEDAQGKGWMNKACRELIRHGFEQLDLRSIHAECAGTNAASIRLLDSLGFDCQAKVQGPDWAQSAGISYLRFCLNRTKWSEQKS